MLRQAITTTPKELRKIADDLEKEWAKSDIFGESIKGVKFQLNIINKQPKCSDTWKFE